MPQVINGKRLTDKEHRIWKHVFDSTHDGAQATAAVQKYRRGRRRKGQAEAIGKWIKKHGR